MIVLNVFYEFDKAGERERYLKALCDKGIVADSRAEAGNLKYDYYFAEGSDTELLLVEHWADAAVLDAHTRTSHFQPIPSVKEQFNVTVRLERYETA